MLNYQLVEAIAKKAEVSEEVAEKMVKAFADVLREALTQRGESVTVRNLGTFKMKDNKELPDHKDLIFTSLM